MDDTTLKRVQIELLTIAKEVARVCYENGIGFFLVGGTLIGAVRHRGFIPWDDDLDMGMMRADFERFVQIAPDCLGEGFFLQTWHSDSEYANAFAKVRMEGTVYHEANDPKIKKHQGFFVDIFPYDNIPEDAAQLSDMSRRIMRYRRIMLAKNGISLMVRKRGFLRLAKTAVTSALYKVGAVFVSREKLIQRFEAEMNRFNGSQTTRVCQESGGAAFGKYPIKKSYLKTVCNLQFEDTTFPCPGEYDSFLRDIYGNYMKLPPLKNQKPSHGILEIKFRD